MLKGVASLVIVSLARLTRRSGFPAMLAVFQHKSQLSVFGEFRNDP